MDKDFGKIKKNETTDIIIRADDFGGKVGLTIREYTTSEKYTGFTKSGTRIPLDSIEEFKEVISKIKKSDIEALQSRESIKETKGSIEESEQKKLEDDNADNEQTTSENDNEIKEEFF